MRLADRSDLKQANRRTVYEYIKSCEEQTASCTQISRDTGISMPTVAKITSFFESKGLLAVLGVQESNNVGRHPILYKFLPAAYISIGMAYDGKFLEIVAVDQNSDMLSSRKIRVYSPIEQLMARDIPRELDAFISGADIPCGAVHSIGLALPVAIDTDNYITYYPAPLIGIHASYDFRAHCDALAQKYGCPVFIENDVNAAAIGELKQRSLGGGDDLIYITLGNGIGAGILLGGTLRRGKNFAAGEIGNMVYGGEGSCECPGQSTVEARLSPDNLRRMFGYNVFEDNEGIPSDTVSRVADYVARHLSFVILNMAAILDVERFVLGGFVVDALDEPIFRYIPQYLQHGSKEVSVSPESVPFVAARGAGAQAMDNALNNILLDAPGD